MKILFLTDNFPPEVNAPATRTFEHCKEWVAEGIDVTIITCNPNFPQGKVYSGYKNKLLPQKEIIEGIKVIRVWSYMSKNSGFLKRTLDYISYAITSFFAGLFVKTDVIIATSPQFFTAISGYMLSVFKRKKWIFELRDLWPETIRSVSAVKSTKVLDFLEKIEIYLYKKADLIISVTNSFKSNLINRSIDPSKIKIITNGVNRNVFNESIKAHDLVDDLGLQDKFIIGYIGTHGMTHNLEGLISNIPNDESLHFVFIGDGACKSTMIKIASERGLKNVTFLDPVGKNEIAKYWSFIDVALVPLRKSSTFLEVLPSKMFEAAAMGKPILLGVDGEARQLIEKFNCGIFFEPENCEEMVEKAKGLKDNELLYQELASNGLEMADNFDRKVLATKMLKLIKEEIK